MSGSDWFSTKTNHQTKPTGFLINQSDPTNGEGLDGTKPNLSIRFDSVGKTVYFLFIFKNQKFKVSK